MATKSDMSKASIKDAAKNGAVKTPITVALAKLNAALATLDHAVDTSLEARNKVRTGDEEVQRLADDRAKLAQDVDKAEARAERLAKINSEVSRRLVGAMETVRGVLDKST